MEIDRRSIALEKILNIRRVENFQIVGLIDKDKIVFNWIE